MSTDNYYVRVGRIEGKKVTMHCMTGFSGGLKDYSTTRSFALLLLVDAKERASSTPYLTKGAPKDVAKARNALAKKVQKASSSLIDEVGMPGFEDEWHAENTPTYVAKSRLLKRHNAIDERKLRKVRDELSPLEEKGKGAFLEAAWGRLHGFDLEVEVTDAKYLDHLQEGHLFSTTAFDAWIESKPLRPKPKQEKPAEKRPTAEPEGNYKGLVLENSFFWPSSYLHKTDVSGSNFQGADLTTVIHDSGIKAVKCDFTKARMTKKTHWDGATMIREWNLKDSLLRGASLADAKFIDCDLSGCDFTNADLRHARFLSSNLKGAIFKGANLEGALIPPELARKANLDGAKKYTPAPGGTPGAKCRALDRMMFEAKAIEFTVDFTPTKGTDMVMRISLGRYPYLPKQPGRYRLGLQFSSGRNNDEFTSCFAPDVEPGTFGSLLRRLSDDLQAPPERTLDLSTLTVKGQNAPRKDPELKEAVRAALAEVFTLA